MKIYSVITVGSSSVSYAVLHSKPILFITSDEMEESGYINHNAAPISIALDLSPINIDRIDKNSRKEIREKCKPGAITIILINTYVQNMRKKICVCGK